MIASPRIGDVKYGLPIHHGTCRFVDDDGATLLEMDHLTSVETQSPA